jgi:hypothetical protein
MLTNKYFVNFYCKKFGIRKPEFVRTSIVSPGAKTVDGLYDKLKRKVDTAKDGKFNLADIADLNRCTILIDDYDDAVSTVKKLKDKIPALVGEIHNRKGINGYRGINLNFYTEDGVPAEIQIATPETNYVKQVSQAEYNIFRSMSREERRHNREELQYNKDLTQQLNNIAFADGAFDRNVKDLEELLFEYGKLEKPAPIPPILNKIITKESFSDPTLLKMRLAGVVEFLQEPQRRFLAKVTDIVKYKRLGVSYGSKVPKLARLRNSPAGLLSSVVLPGSGQESIDSANL